MTARVAARTDSLMWPVVLVVSLGLEAGLLVAGLPNLEVLVLGLGAVTVAAAVLARPKWGLVALVPTHFFALSEVVTTRFPAAPQVTDLLVALLLVSVAARFLILGERPVIPVAVVVLLMIYAALGFAGVFYSLEPMLAFGAAVDLVKQAIIVVLVVTMIREPGDLRLAVVTLVLSGGVLAGLGVVQYLTGDFTQSFGGLAQSSRDYVSNVGGGQYAYRFGGTIGLPNVFARMLVVLVPFAFYVASHARTRFGKVAGWLSLASISIGILLTFSRGAFLAVAVIVVVMLAVLRPSPVAIGGLLLAVVVSASLLPQHYMDRLGMLTEALPGVGTPELDPSVRGRTGEALAGLEMFVDHPFVGVGLHNYSANYLRYSRAIGIDPRRQDRMAHDLVIEVGAEAGVVGLGVFAGVVIVAARSLRRMRSSTGDESWADSQLAATIGLGLSGYLVASLFLHLAYPGVFWLLVALAMAAGNVHGRASPEVRG